jgi:hypothetical protein
VAQEANAWSRVFEFFLTGDTQDNGEHRGYCPVCEDPESSSTPSASYNLKNETFKCFGKCAMGMGFKKLLNVIKEEWPELSLPRPPRSNVRSIDDAPSRRGKGRPKLELPDDETLRQWTEALRANKAKMSFLVNERGLDEATIEKFELGWYNGRITIPVRDADGVLVNVRRYKSDAKQSRDKMYNMTGYGEARLFLPWMLEEDTVIIFEGEMDALLGQHLGLPAMTHTAGASVWKDTWSVKFQGKTVFICYDVDASGMNGARKVGQKISQYAKEVFVIKLPIQIPGGDFTDYIVKQGYSKNDFLALMDESRQSPFGAQRRKNGERRNLSAERSTLEDSMNADTSLTNLEVFATVAGKVQPAYLMPKTIRMSCTQDHYNTAACNRCPLNDLGGEHVKRIPEDDSFLLNLVDKSEEAIDKLIRKDMGIPSTCQQVDFDNEESWNVEELILMPSMDNRAEQSQTPMSRRIYNVGEYKTPVNTEVRIVGFNTSDPRNSRSAFQSWICDPVQTSIDKYKMTKDKLRGLSVFRPKKGQTPLEKMIEIARDLQANVTHIYGRDALHVAYDVVWHSAMNFKFRGQPIGKGWLELLVLGDTRTGKSEAAMRLSEHYRAGILKSCEGTTFAGLVGGAQQMGNSWMVTWGTIPLNDRRLVVLDEVSGAADKNIIEQMSSVRSSGRAQITKIVSQETSARTRLIWISNPLDGRTIKEMHNGAIEGIQQLVKNPEDLARFDLAMSAASDEVESSVINAVDPPKVKHRYTTDRCSELIAWAWSRKVDDITWVDGTEEYVLEVAEKMGSRYVPDPPLIQTENLRVKLARIAVAIAIRLFNSDETGEKVVVGNEHVYAAAELLHMLYSDSRFGYLDHSRKTLRDRAQAEENSRQCRLYLAGNESVLHGLLSVRGGNFKLRDFEEFAAMHRDEAQDAVRTLMSLKMVQRMSKGYIRMDPALIAVLKKLEDELE